jgi:hypothetical protein
MISAHRHSMFADNQFAPEDDFNGMDAAFEPWVRERLDDGRYVGLLIEDEERSWLAQASSSATFLRIGDTPSQCEHTCSTSTPSPGSAGAVWRSG